jgi:hypothetical protein
VSIDINHDPIQTQLETADPIKVIDGDCLINIRPRASYILTGIVLGRKNYRWGWNAAISPCDLAVAWGKMALTGLHNKVKWSQDNRWYFWRYDDEFPFDNSFISRYSSNTHCIPANENIKAALNKISRGDTVSLAGLLVWITASKGGNDYWWNSSLSREDTGDGSCEVMYIDQIKYRGMAYH